MKSLLFNSKFINTALSIIIILIERDDGKKKQTLADFTA